MAPKKKEVQKLSLNEFMTNDSFGSWAEEVEEEVGTQALPAPERRSGATSYGGGGGENRYGGYSSIRDNLPQKLPDKPPFTAHLGNLSYDATVETVTEFFEGCNLVNVRIIEDREQQRPKGFAYAEFGDLEGLKTALTLDSRSFQGRSIRIKIADPPKERYGGGGLDSNRDLSDWTRKGPLADIPGARPERRGADFGERRPPREPQADDGKFRDFGNWERRGPLSPLPQAEHPPPSRDGSRAPRMDRSESQRGPGNRHQSPAWGPSEGRQDSRPPRREFVERPERPERVPTAAEKDFNWRNNMKPAELAKSPVQSRDGSEAPPSPAISQATAPAGRPRLQLAKRTVSDAPDLLSPASTAESKASPFGAARPIDTAAREKDIAEKREQALQAKKEAEEKAKEERRLAKEAAAKEAAEKEAAEAKAAETAEAEQKEREEQAAVADAAEAANGPAVEGAAAPKEEPISNGDNTQQKAPARREPREPREPREKSEQFKSDARSRANESINWRSASGEQRRGSGQGGQIPSGPRRGGGPPRGPRNDSGRDYSGRGPRTNGNGPASAHQAQPPQNASADQSSPSTPVADEDGWTTVPNKARGGGRR